MDLNPAHGAKHHFKYIEPHVLKSAGNKKVRIIKILQFPEAKRALGIVHREGRHGILGFAVLAILAGMRPSEIYDLAKMPNIWDDYIKLDKGVLNVEGFGKQSDQRTIDLEPVTVSELKYRLDVVPGYRIEVVVACENGFVEAEVPYFEASEGDNMIGEKFDFKKRKSGGGKVTTFSYNSGIHAPPITLRARGDEPMILTEFSVSVSG